MKIDSFQSSSLNFPLPDYYKLEGEDHPKDFILHIIKDKAKYSNVTLFLRN